MKKHHKFLTFLLMAIFMVACNQNMLGVGRGVQNFLSLPIDGISNAYNSITGNTYGSYRVLAYSHVREVSSDL